MAENRINIPTEEDKMQEAETYPSTTHPQTPSQREANARDANFQFLWSFSISRLRDWIAWASTLVRGSISNIPQETSLYEKDSNSDIPRQTEFDAGKPNMPLEEIRPNIPQGIEEQNSSEPHEWEGNTQDRGRLHDAAVKGNWQVAKSIVRKYKDAIRASITKGKETALHIAVEAKQTTFVEELLEIMTAADLELRNEEGETAFCYVAKLGTVNCAKKMLKINSKLPCLRRRYDFLPIHVAFMSGQKIMATYLFSVTSFENLTPADRINLFILTIERDMYDLAYHTLDQDSTLAAAHDVFDQTALGLLAKKPLSIGNTSELPFWRRYLNFWFNALYNKAPMQTSTDKLLEKFWGEIKKLPEKQLPDLVNRELQSIHAAAKSGNKEFLTTLINVYSDLTWKRDEDGNNLFHIAILYRQEKVVSLLWKIGSSMEFYNALNDCGNNLLHHAGMLSPQCGVNMRSGPALQMREELLWFKEIEEILPPLFTRHKNLEGKTPHDMFMERHGELRKDGKKWMKETANNCMLVVTLIATVVFAAAFTVPGGNNQESGTPIFLKSNWFLVFFLSNAIALLSSSTSILIFLSILISSCTDKDFINLLPRRMLFGFTMLSISILSMVVAFSAMCFLVYRGKTTWIPIGVISVAGVSVLSFVWLHRKFWSDLVNAARGSKNLFGPRERGFPIILQFPRPTID